jgi:hypothetical protein
MMHCGMHKLTMLKGVGMAPKGVDTQSLHSGGVPSIVGVLHIAKGRFG